MARLPFFFHCLQKDEGQTANIPGRALFSLDCSGDLIDGGMGGREDQTPLPVSVLLCRKEDNITDKWCYFVLLHTLGRTRQRSIYLGMIAHLLGGVEIPQQRALPSNEGR